MSCELYFGTDFACECPLPRNIVQMHTIKAAVRHYYLPQMRVCQMGARVVRMELSKPAAWGACFCRQYLEMQCQSVRLIHDAPFLSTSDEGPKRVLVEMRFQQSVLRMPAFPLCVGLTVVPIQRCVRRFVNYRRALRQKALYWADVVTRMCAKQTAAAEMLHPLHQIGSNEDLMCMILHALSVRSFKATPHLERSSRPKIV